MSIISSFSNLPVFQVSGKSEVDRGRFIQLLMAALEGQSLCGVFLRQKEWQSGSQYALLSQVKLYDYIILDAGVDLPAQQIRLEGHEQPARNSMDWQGGNDLEMQQFAGLLVERMDELARRNPIWGCILIGGKSSTDGTTKTSHRRQK